MDNKTAAVIRAIGWITMICGFIGGIILSYQTVEVGYYYTYEKEVFVWTTAILYWSASLVSGIVFLGFAEIITLLQKIVDAIKSFHANNFDTIKKAEEHTDELPDL